MSPYRQLRPGEPAPWFHQRNTSNPDYVFDTVGGRYIVLCFSGTARDDAGRRALQFAFTHRPWFDDVRMSFFGVSVDPEDERAGRMQEAVPGIRHFWDFDGTASRLYGALPMAATHKGVFRRLWVVLDPGLHVLAVLPIAEDGSDQPQLARLLQGLPPLPNYAGLDMHAPVLIMPNLLEPALCARLVSVYERLGGEASGIMVNVQGKTKPVSNVTFKSRSDVTIVDEQLVALLQRRVKQKVVPLVRKAFCFGITRMERYTVACYDSKEGGFFHPHRDNTLAGTAHRRIALSVNLNDDFEGGTLNFPEYGPRNYKMPAGTGVAFSCTLLHQVLPVTQGRRYAFLPFLYDEESAALREEYKPFLDDGLGT